MISNKLNDLIFSNKIFEQIKLIPYGTAGYRMNFKDLDGIIIRMSVLAVMRSIYKKKCVGIMITASHNPECDNGVKLIDPNGDMLSRDWESIAMELVRWDEAEFLDKFNQKCSELGIQLNDKYKGHVFVGYDTRCSSPKFAKLASNAIKLLDCHCSVFEFVTTPQLHFFVKQFNDDFSTDNQVLINHYFDRLAKGFCWDKVIPKHPTILNVDCANGVGAKHLLHLSKYVKNYLDLRLFNTETDNLNLDCGADHVKIKQSKPVIYNGDQHLLSLGDRWCSIDGDADRLVYFYLSPSNQFHLLDGDKMAVLIADYLSEILKEELQSNKFSMAIIQTAYANSASTEYIKEQLKIETECVPTGVKYLHKAAKQYDIGIYFEANGHGTVLFSEKLRQHNHSLGNNCELKRFMDVINEADGDAISDLLIIEHILFMRNWTLEQWSNLYQDYPSRQLKVPVPDRNIIITTDAERKIKSPLSIQKAIDQVVQDQLICGLKHSRAFVRPSGTEDIVRVYAESSTQSSADELADLIAKIVKQHFE